MAGTEETTKSDSNEQHNAVEAVETEMTATSEGTAQDAVEPSEKDTLQERITALEQQLQQVQQNEREMILRAKAEVENIRRRTEQDVEKAHKFAFEKFAHELLPVIDNLERALQSAQDDTVKHPVLEGVELTLKSLLDTVRKFGVEAVNKIGIPFNPEIHQAMSMQESEEFAANHVIMVMQKGYTLNGRLLRPAMVAVSKGKGEAK